MVQQDPETLNTLTSDQAGHSIANAPAALTFSPSRHASDILWQIKPRHIQNMDTFHPDQGVAG